MIFTIKQYTSSPYLTHTSNHNIYQTLRSWNSRPGKDVSLVLTTPDGEKEVVLKTADGEQIARQMETKARALAVEHKARKKKAKADAAADAAGAHPAY